MYLTGTEAEAANRSTNLDQDDSKNTGSKKKCSLEDSDEHTSTTVVSPAGEEEELDKCDLEYYSETDNTKKEVLHTEPGEETEESVAGIVNEEKEKEVKELNN